MSVRFEDFTVKVNAAIDEAANAFLHEAAGELTAQVARNVPNKGHFHRELAQSFRYEVDRSKREATIGSPLERALWNEYGTGEFSDSPKGGRHGYWVYVKDSNLSDSGGYTYTGGKQYTLEEAKRIVAMMRADGLDASYTKGQLPNRSMRKAYTKMKPKIIRAAQERFKKL